MSHNVKVKSLVGAVALSFAAVGASASPIDLTYMGTTAVHANNVKVTTTSTDPDRTITGGAYGFRMQEGTPADPLTEFLAWCLDIESWLGTGSSYEYEITNTPFSNSHGLDASQLGRVANVFDANYGDLDDTDGIQAAGFQVALWNALYDDDSDAGDGDFKVLSAASGIVDQANTYLGLAAGYGDGKKFNLTFYESTGTGDDKKQNLVSATPVPLPAAGFLLLGSLSGLIAMRRRKRAA